MTVGGGETERYNTACLSIRPILSIPSSTHVPRATTLKNEEQDGREGWRIKVGNGGRVGRVGRVEFLTRVRNPDPSNPFES